VEDKNKINLEEAFQGLFEGASGTGEEELLRIASTYSRQITGEQMRGVIFLKLFGSLLPEENRYIIDEIFIKSWLELKQYNNSAIFVMKALEYISLKKFLGENAIKVNVEKR
jgi:hypothetical protein